MVPEGAIRAKAKKCFPRASGDGPLETVTGKTITVFPPRERGWSPGPQGPKGDTGVSPARAGMVPTGWTASRRPSRFPRASGDGPPIAKKTPRPMTFPPRERGWSLAGPAGRSVHNVSPARAGMVPGGEGNSEQGHRFPRASGDGPRQSRRRHMEAMFPPRERGWSLTMRNVGRTMSVSPARAGMVPRGDAFAHGAAGFPRASGDGPTVAAPEVSPRTFPPRERGWSRARSQEAQGRVVSPARAGMVP